jgi:hypothetical protein
MGANYFSDQKRGDTFNGRKITLKKNGTAIDLTGATVLMQFKLDISGISRFEFKTANGSITIPNPLTGQIIMMPKVINEVAGIYYFDMQITFPNGTVKTYLSGKWNITEDVSR